MNAIRNLWNAFTNLATALNGLAGLVNDASNRLRLQLGDEMPPQLAHGSPTGEIVDCSAIGAIVPETPSTKRNGRKAAA